MMDELKHDLNMMHVWNDSWAKNDEFGMALVLNMNEGWL